MTTNRTQPEVQTGILAAQPHIPHQDIYSPTRQKELMRIVVDTLAREVPHVVSQLCPVWQVNNPLFDVDAVRDGRRQEVGVGLGGPSQRIQ